ncbi:MAG: hypothetical protein M3R38_28995 [Actinomycetota bacterium]|nr:hypothetical protein [Actinomycetota bacterium]
MLLRLPEEALAVPVELRWGRRDTGCEAIEECLAHGFGHAGTIRGAGATGGFALPVEG